MIIDSLLRRLLYEDQYVREQFFRVPAAQNIKRLVRILNQRPTTMLPATT
jgi:hypothetical protein